MLLITNLSAQNKDSTGFFLGFNYGEMNVNGFYGSSDNSVYSSQIDNAVRNGYATNTGIWFLDGGFDVHALKLRILLSYSKYNSGFNDIGFFNYYVPHYFSFPTQLIITKISQPVNYDSKYYLGGVDKYFSYKFLSVDLRLLAGYYNWNYPGFSSSFYMDYFNTNYYYNIAFGTGSSVFPVFDIGAGLRVRIFKNFSLTGNVDYLGSFFPPTFNIPYTISGAPLPTSPSPANNGKMSYLPDGPELFNITVGLEYELIMKKKKP